MKECIQCGKSFKAIKETAKYCSTSCRVMWNRKQPKKNKVEPFQMQVLYNSILEAIDKLSAINISPPVLSGIINNTKEIDVLKADNNDKITDEDIEQLALRHEIPKRITEIRAEKIPKERDTPFGRKIWNNEQQNRINELKKQLNGKENNY